MVEDLITLSPHFRETFNKFVPLERQRKLSFSAFHNLKDEYMNTPEAEAKRLEMRQNPRKKGYFFTNRDFSGRLVPESFHRTEAPRLAAYGSTLYGMALPLARRLYLTQIEASFEGDTFFPKIDLSAWNEVACERIVDDEKVDFTYRFITLEKCDL